MVSRISKLYHLNIVLSNGGRVLDRVKSYFALRKVDVRKDECGYNRICLNNQPIFQYGPLDQGWYRWIVDSSFRGSDVVGHGAVEEDGIQYDP